MKKGWRLIILVVLVAVLLGAVAVAVGFMTGAETTRIYSVLDARYNLQGWYHYFLDVYSQIQAVFFSA